MDSILFLEQLSNTVHYSPICKDLLQYQEEGIKLAFIENNPEEIQRRVSEISYYADNIMVI